MKRFFCLPDCTARKMGICQDKYCIKPFFGFVKFMIQKDSSLPAIPSTGRGYLMIGVSKHRVARFP
jgi:hypothetical protein